MLVSTGSHGRGVERTTEGTRDEADGRVQLHIDRTCVSRAWPDWGAVVCCWIAKRQSRMMTAECWRPMWNRLVSSTSCFGSSAWLQSLSSVLCRTAYSLESPQDRLGGTHAEGAGHKGVIHFNWYKIPTTLQLHLYQHSDIDLIEPSDPGHVMAPYKLLYY